MVTMTKSVEEPIVVRAMAGDRYPSAFTWRERSFRVVEVGGTWRLVGRWWEGDGERHFVRVVTDAGKCFDLCRYKSTGQWHVHKVYD